MLVVKSGTLYFVLVFSAGFVLGTIRTLWAAPAIGARTAEVMEAPVMIVISYFAARWSARRLHVPAIASTRLAMGALALGLMLMAEFLLVARLRGMSLREYMAIRDPLAALVYYFALIVFAILPTLVARH